MKFNISRNNLIVIGIFFMLLICCMLIIFLVKANTQNSQAQYVLNTITKVSLSDSYQLATINSKNGTVSEKTNVSEQDFIIWHEYEPKIVEVEGVLHKSTSYGPPNYGETPEIDEKVEYYTLEMESAINVKGNDNSGLNSTSYENIKIVQVVFDVKTNAEELCDKKLIIKGTLFEAFSGHHFTEVVLNVINIFMEE